MYFQFYQAVQQRTEVSNLPCLVLKSSAAAGIGCGLIVTTLNRSVFCLHTKFQ
jgi:hypothetical protein